ncbi:MAG: hypothetical protein M1531_11550 [Chloroflexi bacterium]|nr:hypothetical protein [Chloroflexota bacterium]
MPVLSTSGFFLDHNSASSVSLLTFLFVILMLCGSISFVGYKVFALMPEPTVEPGPRQVEGARPLTVVPVAAVATPTPTATSTLTPDAEGVPDEDGNGSEDEDAPPPVADLSERSGTSAEPDPNIDAIPPPDVATPTPSPQVTSRPAPAITLPRVMSGQPDPGYRLSKVRYSSLPGQARIILDLTLRPFTLDEPTWDIVNTPERITIHLGISAARWLSAPKDSLVKRIEIAPTSANSADLIIDLAQPVARVASALLKGPDSLVFDFYAE